MFAPCPHCGYLMALIATADPAPRECPRCHRLVDTHVQPPVRSVPAEPPPTPATPDVPTTAPPPAAPATSTQNDAQPAPRAPVAVAQTSAPADAAGAAPGAQPDARDASSAPHHAVDATTAAASPAPHAPHIERIDATPPPRMTPATTPAPAPRTGTSPSFARRRHAVAASPRATWAWRLGAFALAALLAVQLLLAQRDTLAHDARWRPWLVRVCGIGLCTVPPGRDASAFEMVERSVRPLAGSRELAVHARFRNAAPWPQAWPHLQLVLSDAQGRPAAARVFAPSDYAGDLARRAIAPGQTVHARLRVVEPQPATVAFAFDFR